MSGRNLTRVLLAERQELVRQSLKAILEIHDFAVVGEASDGRQFVEKFLALRPDIAVVDEHLPLLNGIDAVTRLMRQVRDPRILVLTAGMVSERAWDIWHSDCIGYFLKTEPAAEFVRAVQTVTRGTVYISPHVRPRASANKEADSLSLREHEVLQLNCEGKISKQIAALVGISPKTAESHRAHISAKLGVHRTADLVRYAVRHGIIEA